MSRSRRNLYRAIIPITWPTKGEQKKMARRLLRRMLNRTVSPEDDSTLTPKRIEARGNRGIRESSMQVWYGAGSPLRKLGRDIVERLRRK